MWRREQPTGSGPMPKPGCIRRCAPDPSCMPTYRFWRFVWRDVARDDALKTEEATEQISSVGKPMDECRIFMTALDKSSPEERTAFLDEACRGDAALRQ